ncbi:MAG: Tol-Pal system beta propeller repeat protein TolB [Candidatus Eisenbacteria bacterium]|nr:Tol-Pal system beta propeller repeat protein TolB [Candidatus Eisenbacteria bacterium]
MNRAAAGRIVWIVLLAWAAGSPPVRPQSEVEMEIRSGEAFRIPILVQPMGRGATPVAPGVLSSMQGALVQDLGYTDLFRVFVGTRESSWTEVAGPEDENTPPPEPQAVVISILETGGDEVVLKGMMEDYTTGRQFLSEKYRAPADMDVWAAHAFCDDVTRYLTGEAGIAQTRIALVGRRGAGETSDVWLIDWDGRRLSRLTDLGSIVVSTTWAPEGRRLAFTSYHTGMAALAGVDIQDADLWLISEEAGLNTAPAWSPRGDRLAFTLSRDGNAEIYTARPDGRDKQRLTFNPTIDTAPAWSPSGRQIAFTSDRSGRPQVYVMDADGSAVRRLTYWGAWNDSPDWSPTGERIVFAGQLEGGFDLFLIHPDGSGLRRLTQVPGDCENPRWAPDGRHIVYSRRSGNERRLYVLDAESLRERPLTPATMAAYNPAWSAPLKPSAAGAQWHPAASP